MRICTCHQDDNPPIPCAGQYALGMCREVARSHKVELGKDGPFWIIEAASPADASLQISAITGNKPADLIARSI